MQRIILIGLLAATWMLSIAIANNLQAAEGNATSLAQIRLTPADAKRLTAQRSAFINAPDLTKRLERLQNFEQQALQLAVDEPLKLGSIGSAILDIYPGSQTGQFAMRRFYEHVESVEAQQSHNAELTLLQAHMRASGSGTAIDPFKVVTIYDAHTYAASNDKLPVGSIYQSNQSVSFGFMLVARPQGAPLQKTYFDISHVLDDFIEHARKIDQADTQHKQSNVEKEATQAKTSANPWTYMRLLASQMDSAAQAAIGSYLASVKKYDDAITWLQVAARAENVLANALLTRIYWTQADQETDSSKREILKELVLENHLHAITLGSTDSMYTLASLYLSDYFGADNREAGIALLHQSGELQHVESLLYLGHLYNAGMDVKQNTATAEVFFSRAANLNNPQAIISYGRFLSGRDGINQEQKQDDKQIKKLLQSIADRGNAEAMIVLGNLYARGINGRSSNRRAIKWYKKAVRADTENGDIVNEVAWTLSVSDVDGLPRGKYAKRIMDKLMANVPEMRKRPEYLDTWAATHAAIGDFNQAIILQNEAIAEATSQQREDVLDILKDHLDKFKAGAVIKERAP